MTRRILIVLGFALGFAALAGGLVSLFTGRRSVSVTVRIVAHVTVTDGDTGEGIAGATVFVGSAHIQDRGLREEILRGHRIYNDFQRHGAGYGVTNETGAVIIVYPMHRSWVEHGVEEGRPGACGPTYVWCGHPRYESRAVETDVRGMAVRGEAGWECEVKLDPVTLKPLE